MTFEEHQQQQNEEAEYREYRECKAVDAAVADMERFQLPDYAESQAEFAGEVWQKMSAIDVNDHTEQKGGFTYLSWNWAWNTLMSSYPASSYKFAPDTVTDEGVMVFCELTVSNGKNSLKREMWLPVLDFRNKPIVKPNPMDINNARMRCLVKTMAMAGLGNYIYSGEKAPPNSDKQNQVDTFNQYVQENDGARLFDLLADIGQEDFGQLVAQVQGDPKSKTNPRGNKTKKHNAIWKLIDDFKDNLTQYALNIDECFENRDEHGALEFIEECVDLSKHQKRFFWSELKSQKQFTDYINRREVA